MSRAPRVARGAGLLAPLVMLALFAASAGIWLAMTDAAAAHEDSHAWQEAPVVPLSAIDPALRPLVHTQAFVPAAAPLGVDVPTVYLYRSPTTERYLGQVGGRYQTLLEPWRAFFRERPYRLVETARLDDIPRHADTVLILPSALALSASERRGLRALQQSGAGILATWSPGTRDAKGEWVGHGLYEQLFGVSVAGELPSDSEARFLNLFGDTPLTAGYPAGRRVWIEATSEVALRLAGGTVAANYMNWIRTGGSDASMAAVLYGEHGAERAHARWVAFGFAETSWGVQADKLTGLLENSLHWLARGVSVHKAAWPAPYRAAYLIEMDTEDGFANARHFAAMMEAHGLRSTFYSLTSEARRYPHLVRRLAERHEIAFHGDVHDGFRGQSAAEQGRRLERMLAEMRAITGGAIPTVGFRAPREEYDRVTERLLHEKGFRHHAADPERTDARLPFFSESGSADPETALVVLPRTQNDDISLHAGDLSENAPQRLREAMLADFHNVLEMGGLGLLSVHSQYFGDDGALHAALPAFLEAVAARRAQVWVAGANEIADWWRQRERFRLRLSGTAQAVRLDLEVEGEQSLPHGAVIVTHRRAGLAPQVAAEPELRRRISVIPLDAFRSAVVFADLKPGAYRILLLSKLTALTAPADYRAAASALPAAVQ